MTRKVPWCRVYAAMRMFDSHLRTGTVQELVKATKALSDETRLRILNVLLERESCVCEVMQALEISQSRASRNLGILLGTGLLRARREGTWVLYSVDERSENRFAVGLAALLEGFFAHDEILHRDRQRLKHSVRVGPGCETEQEE